MQLVAMDILGPLPETASGNKYVLVAGDYFTRWMEAYPLPNQEATTVATKLVDELFCRFSLPEQLHSDQGRQFESDVIKEICKLLQIDKTRTTLYHPQCDGLIERFNCTLTQMLSTCLTELSPHWEEQLPKLCMAYNSSKQSTTGYSPFFLMFGREAHLPVDLLYSCDFDLPLKDLPSYVQNLRNTLTAAFTKVCQHVGNRLERQQEFYNKQVHGNPHEPGTLVWLFSPVVPRGRAKKFHRPWTGPYRVLASLSDSTYKIQHLYNHKIKVVHFDRLKAYPANMRLPQRTFARQPVDKPSHPSFPGSTLELLDDDDYPDIPTPPTGPNLLPSLPSRYPTRTRQVPDRYGNFVTH